MLRGLSRPLQTSATSYHDWALHLLFRQWSSYPANYERVMLWASCTLGFFGFMRSGEFTTTHSHRHCPLSASDIQIDDPACPKLLAVTLRHSKTDPVGAGGHNLLGEGRRRYLCSGSSIGIHGNSPATTRPPVYPPGWQATNSYLPNVISQRDFGRPSAEP